MEPENNETNVLKTDNKIMPFAFGAIALLVVVGGIVFFMNNGKQSNDNVMGEETTNNDAVATVTPSASPASTTEGNVKTVEIEAGSFYYKPNVITVKKGDTVKVVLKSMDMMHDFYIDELGVKGPITKGGETSTVEFVASKVGTFEYYCSVGQHRKNGQVGKITVTE